MTVLSSVSCCSNNLCFLNNIHASAWWSVFLRCADAVKLRKKFIFFIWLLCLQQIWVMLITFFVFTKFVIFWLTVIQIWTLPKTQFNKWSGFKNVSKSSQVNVPPSMSKKSYSDNILFSQKKIHISTHSC